MATLQAMPEQSIIDGFKGTLDFYYYRGTPVARKWPHYPPRAPYTAEALNQDAFRYITQLAPNLPLIIQQAYTQMAQGIPYRWQDILVRGYISGLGF